jgi:hypothetical protein
MRYTTRHPRDARPGTPRRRPAAQPAATGEATSGRARGERGFALLVSLIAIVGLTALATGGFFLADSERKTSTNHHASVEAFHLAEAGLNQFLGNTDGQPATGWRAPYDYPDADGEAAVLVERVGTTRDGQDLYRVLSEGRYRPDGPNPVTRRVGTITVLNMGTLPTPPASVTSGGGITKNGNSGLISGVNPDSCGGGSRAGVRVPEDPGYNGKEDPLEGSPLADSVSNPFDFLPDPPEDWWQGVIDGTTIPHDYTLKSDDSSANWPDFSQVGDDEMPVTYVDKNSIELGDEEDGRGLLVVRGDATFKGQFDWDGVILIGGAVTDNGQGKIQGGVMTGLNVLLGEDVGQDDLEDVDTLDGTKKYLFNMCIIEQVQNATATLSGVSSTWHEEI